MKKQRRSKKQWQELFELRKTFQGSTEEFCRQYEVPNSSYYTNYKAFLTEEELSNISKTKAPRVKKQPHFVKVIQPAKPHPVTPHANVRFNTKTGELSLPTTLETQTVVAIIKGLMA